MRHILVTGSKGQLGRCIQKIAADYPQFQFHFHDAASLDITERASIARVFGSNQFDYCINCAAYTNVEQAEKTPKTAFSVNADGVRNLAEFCLKYQTVLIHISTDYVFDGEKKTPYFPSDETNPINEYGKSKLKGEEYIKELLQRYYIIRSSWLYSEFGTNFYNTILKKVKAGEDLQITDRQTGCPTNANNLAVYVLNLIGKGTPDFGIHHFTDGVPMTWYDFASRIIKENKLERKVKLVKAKNYRTFATRPINSILG